MSIPQNPIPSEEEQGAQNAMIQGADIVPLDEPVEPTTNEHIESPTEPAEIIESTYLEIDGTLPESTLPQKKSTAKPARIAILTILGLFVLCCVMAGIMFLLLRAEIFAGAV